MWCGAVEHPALSGSLVPSPGPRRVQDIHRIHRYKVWLFDDTGRACRGSAPHLVFRTLGAPASTLLLTTLDLFARFAGAPPN